MAKRKKVEKSTEVKTDIEELKELLESDEIEEVTEFIPTSSTLLDYAVSNDIVGGIPVGRITELIGNNQAGKTLMTTHILANTQKLGGIGICIDVEHDMDKQFSTRIGVNWDGLIYKEYLETIEDIVEYIEKVVRTTRLKHKNKLVTIIWDSIAVSRARKEIEGEFNPDKYMGLHAKLMSAAMRKIRPMIKSERIALVCTNQMREKIGVFGFGDNSTTPHGKAMSFYSSLRIKLARTKKIENSDGTAIGAMCQAKIIKNKCGPAWRTVLFPVMYEWGIDNEKSILDFLVDQKVITKAGPYKKIQVPGREGTTQFITKDFREVLREDEEMKKYVFQMVNKHMKMELKARPEDLQIDLDSIMEVEQVAADLEEKKEDV